MKKITLVLLAIGLAASTSMARPRHGGGGYDGGYGGGYGGGHHGGGHHGGGHHGGSSSGGYDSNGEGWVAAILLSTAFFFSSQMTMDSYNAYLFAENDAAEFLASEGQERPTLALAEAMDQERTFLAKAQVQGAEQLSDMDVAYLVMKRANSL